MRRFLLIFLIPIVASMLTAGVASGVLDQTGISQWNMDPATGQTAVATTMADKVIKTAATQAVKSATAATVSVALQKTPVKEALISAVRNTVANTIAEVCAEKLGELRRGADGAESLAYVPHKLGHALAGALAASISPEHSKSDIFSAAFGAAGAEIVAESLQGYAVQSAQTRIAEEGLKGPVSQQRQHDIYQEEIRKVINITKVITATSAMFAGLDVQIASSAAANALDNDFTYNCVKDKSLEDYVKTVVKAMEEKDFSPEEIRELMSHPKFVELLARTDDFIKDLQAAEVKFGFNTDMRAGHTDGEMRVYIGPHPMYTPAFTSRSFELFQDAAVIINDLSETHPYLLEAAIFGMQMVFTGGPLKAIAAYCKGAIIEEAIEPVRTAAVEYFSGMFGTTPEETDVGLGIAEMSVGFILGTAKSCVGGAKQATKAIRSKAVGAKGASLSKPNITPVAASAPQPAKPSAVTRKSDPAKLTEVGNKVGQSTNQMKIKRGKNGRVIGVTHTQEHHIIHEKLNNHELWELSGDNPQSRANKMLLPTKKGKELTSTERSIHQGRHTDASRKPLEEEMDKVIKQGKREGWSKEQYSEKLSEIIKEERRLLKNGEKSLYKSLDSK